MGLGYDAVLQADTQYSKIQFISFHFILVLRFFDLFFVVRSSRGFWHIKDFHNILSVKYQSHTQYISYRIEIYIYMARKYIYMYVYVSI